MITIRERQSLITVKTPIPFQAGRVVIGIIKAVIFPAHKRLSCSDPRCSQIYENETKTSQSQFPAERIQYPIKTKLCESE